MSESIGKKTEGKKCCPTCNQVINSRVLTLRKAHVSAIIKSIKYLATKRVNSFSMGDIEGMLTKTEYACFSDVKKLMPSAVWGPAGEYYFNPNEVMDFLTGGEVVVSALVTPGAKEVMPIKLGTVKDVKGSLDFIKDNKWITEYRRPELKLNTKALV